MVRAKLSGSQKLSGYGSLNKLTDTFGNSIEGVFLVLDYGRPIDAPANVSASALAKLQSGKKSLYEAATARVRVLQSALQPAMQGQRR